MDPCKRRQAYPTETAARAGARRADVAGETSVVHVVRHADHFHWVRATRLDRVSSSRFQKLSERVRRVRRHRLAG